MGSKIVKKIFTDVMKNIFPVIFIQIILEQITNLFYDKLGYESLKKYSLIDINVRSSDK